MKATSTASPMTPSLRAVPFLKVAGDADAIVLTDRQREDLKRIGQRQQLPARRVIYPEGGPADSVYAVAEGAVKTYRDLPSGRCLISAFLFARDIFGLAENGHYLNCAQAITEVTVYRLPVRELAALLKCDADLHFKFLAKVTHELRESQRRSIMISRRDAPGRLAMFLAMMGARTRAGQGEVPLPMTRADIAAFLGLSVETVSRAAALLEHRGIAEFQRRKARILDRGQLARLASAV